MESPFELLKHENQLLHQRLHIFEGCLDDAMRKIANAILTENNLRNHITELQNRVRDLESTAAEETEGSPEELAEQLVADAEGIDLNETSSSQEETLSDISGSVEYWWDEEFDFPKVGMPNFDWQSRRESIEQSSGEARKFNGGFYQVAHIKAPVDESRQSEADVGGEFAEAENSQEPSYLESDNSSLRSSQRCCLGKFKNPFKRTR